MFSCIDTVSLICRRLEACDVISLRRVDKGTHEVVSRLLVGAVVNKQEIREKALFNVSSIPLLDINECFPLYVRTAVWPFKSFCMRRLCRVPELNAEMCCIFMPPYPGRPVCVYVVDGCVKHIITFRVVAHEVGRDGEIRVRTWPAIRSALELHVYFDECSGGSNLGLLNSPLTWAVQWLYGVRDRWMTEEQSESDESVRLGVLHDLHIMSRKGFLRFMVGFDE